MEVVVGFKERRVCCRYTGKENQRQILVFMTSRYDMLACFLSEEALDDWAKDAILQDVKFKTRGGLGRELWNSMLAC